MSKLSSAILKTLIGLSLASVLGCDGLQSALSDLSSDLDSAGKKDIVVYGFQLIEENGATSSIENGSDLYLSGVPISATVRADVSAQVQSVEFILNSEVLLDNKYPFEITFEGAPGSFSLTAVGYMKTGARGASNAKTVTFNIHEVHVEEPAPEDPMDPQEPAPDEPMEPMPEDPMDPEQPEDPTPEDPMDPQPEVALTWAPPRLVNPTTIKVGADSGVTSIKLDDSKDYIIEMPNRPVTRGLGIVGGRNVVMIGGEIEIPDQGRDPSIIARRALIIAGVKGTVHLEGLKMGGADISEGIQINAPDAIVQLQNIRIEGIHARDQVTFKDNHPDLIQTWGGVRELRIDKFTGSTDYQGFLFKSDNGNFHGGVTVRRTNIVGDPTARYMFWYGNQIRGDFVFEDFYIDVPSQRSGGLGKAVWPDANATAVIQTDEMGRKYATWPGVRNPTIFGRITEGLPPGGKDFVPEGGAGIGYQSPGLYLMPSP